MNRFLASGPVRCFFTNLRRDRRDPASAADTPRDTQVLQEIIVTATKRGEKLQDVPMAISAITAEDIQTRGFTNYADYLNTIPGVFFQDGGPGVSQIRIRGISGSEGGLPSTTATYFGETVTSVLTNHGGKPNLRLVDIDRVEVLRGPQGTLFGASALAGVVRIIQRPRLTRRASKPTSVREASSTAHSSDASYHVEGTVNIPLITDQLALRVVAYQDDIAGYIDNKFAGQASVDYGAGFRLPAGLAHHARHPRLHPQGHQLRRHLGRARRARMAGDRKPEDRSDARHPGRDAQQRAVHHA